MITTANVRVAVGAAAGASGVGAGAGLAVLLASEAGIPVPIPADLIALFLGERAATGSLSLVLALLLTGAVALVGTAALLLVCRHAAGRAVARLGPRVGLTEERVSRANSFVERRGRPALTIGRATPGLRTLTVVAAGTSGLRVRRALPALVIGSIVFLEGHVVLGYLLGSSARAAIDRARGPALAVGGALVVGAAILWILRRGRRAGAGAFAESSCPACIAIGLLTANVDRPSSE
jgi:membrane protein DedA with SNARE-associated domain